MGTDATSIDEPVPAAASAAAAGSSPSAPNPVADLLRSLACALLVAGSVGSPGSAVVLAPFVPAIVAIRLVRQRHGARTFLATATLASVAAGATAAAAYGSAMLLVLGVLAGVLLVPGLGLVHARAALRDPADATLGTDWPEPRLSTGLTPTIGGWLLALTVALLVAAPTIESPRALGRDAVHRGYSFYERECAEGGALAARDDFCAEMLAQRDSTVELLDERGAELLAALLAVFAFGAAVTAHQVTTWRARRSTGRVRPSWRMRELEVHWIAAYMVAAGIVGWMLAAGDSPALVALRAAAVCVGVLGALLVASQGIGLAAWLMTRPRTPGWYRALLVLAALFVLPAAAMVVFALGVVDMALHPRRRPGKSGSLPGRGSGS